MTWRRAKKKGTGKDMGGVQSRESVLWKLNKLSFPTFLAPPRVAKRSGGRSMETCQGVLAEIIGFDLLYLVTPVELQRHVKEYWLRSAGFDL